MSNRGSQASVNPEAERMRREALALRARKQTEEAIDLCTKAIALSPDFAAVYRTRGACYGDEVMFDEANADYRRCIELNPGDADCWYNLGRLQACLGDYRAALESCNRGIEN